MITDINQLDLDKTYSYADYLKWGFEERVELIKGKIFKMSFEPLNRGQTLSKFLFNRIKEWFGELKYDVTSSQIITFDLSSPTLDIAPYVSILKNDFRTDSENRVPEWVIDVFSHDNAISIAKTQFNIYQDCGVKEYWIINPVCEYILVYILNEEGKYIGLPPFALEDKITSHVFPDFELSVADIFKD